MEKGSVYIHVPFCVQKCAYCDFYSLAGMGDSMAGYVDALCREIRMQAARFGEIRAETVYIGGGTPSLLEGKDISRILSVLRECMELSPTCEITMEGNPGTLREAALEEYRKAGVNRFSLGVQSFSDCLLRTLGRIHTAAQAAEAVRMLRRAGFSNVNLDIMYGLPGQTESSFLETVGAALTMSPEHLSCYSLIPEEGTEMGRRVFSGEVQLPQEEVLLRMEEEMRGLLKQNGYERYEISNYALPGKECRHNLVYWECEPYLGLGPGAHSDFGGRRFSHPANLRGWMQAINKKELFEEPEDDGSPEKRRFDRMMMGLRMVRGVDLNRFVRDFGRRPEEIWPDTVREMRRLSMIRDDAALSRSVQNPCLSKVHAANDHFGERLALTEKGMDVMNAWLVRMMEEEEKAERYIQMTESGGGLSENGQLRF